MVSRKEFLRMTGVAGIGFMGLQLYACSPKNEAAIAIGDYGPVLKDPAGIMSLPKGFRYTIFSEDYPQSGPSFLAPCDLPSRLRSI